MATKPTVAVAAFTALTDFVVLHTQLFTAFDTEICWASLRRDIDFQRLAAFIVHFICICTGAEQDGDDARITRFCCHVQRCLSVSSRCVYVCASLNELDNHSRVSFTGGIVQHGQPRDVTWNAWKRTHCGNILPCLYQGTHGW
jgi:hypothetical protein